MTHFKFIFIPLASTWLKMTTWSACNFQASNGSPVLCACGPLGPPTIPLPSYDLGIAVPILAGLQAKKGEQQSAWSHRFPDGSQAGYPPYFGYFPPGPPGFRPPFGGPPGFPYNHMPPPHIIGMYQVLYSHPLDPGTCEIKDKPPNVSFKW